MSNPAGVMTKVVRVVPARALKRAVEVPDVAPALESADVHRIFAAEDACWRPGGYQDAEPRENTRRNRPASKRHRPRGTI